MNTYFFVFISKGTVEEVHGFEGKSPKAALARAKRYAAHKRRSVIRLSIRNGISKIDLFGDYIKDATAAKRVLSGMKLIPA